jgi:hypothetical protein
MTTITTVGYGDISGHSMTERVVCIFLHLIGVLSYSFASGSLTSILTNYDQINEKNQKKIEILNRLFRENNLTPDLYYKLKESIDKQDNETEKTEIVDFLNDLP